MNQKISAILWKVAVLLVPSGLVAISHTTIVSATNLRLLLVVLHLITALWAVVFYRRVPVRPTLLPISFLVSATVPRILEIAQTSRLVPQMGQLLFSVLYALPWTAVSLVVSGVLVLRRPRGKHSKWPDRPLEDSDPTAPDGKKY